MAKLATIHHLACTGGTVMTRCLAALPRCFVLSEVHPTEFIPDIRFEPAGLITQFQTQYASLTDAEMIAGFIGQVRVLLDSQALRTGTLLLRDHAHYEFTRPKSRARGQMVAALGREGLPFRSCLTYRDPLESYVSLIDNQWTEGSSFESYCEGWLAFMDLYSGLPAFSFESFTDDPVEIVRGMAAALELEFAPDFLDRQGSIHLTGDSGRKSMIVGARPAKPVPDMVVEQARSSESYAGILRRYPEFDRELA